MSSIKHLSSFYQGFIKLTSSDCSWLLRYSEGRLAPWPWTPNSVRSSTACPTNRPAPVWSLTANSSVNSGVAVGRTVTSLTFSLINARFKYVHNFAHQARSPVKGKSAKRIAVDSMKTARTARIAPNAQKPSTADEAQRKIAALKARKPVTKEARDQFQFDPTQPLRLKKPGRQGK